MAASTQPSTSPTPLPPEWALRLHARLMATYGTPFRNLFPSEAAVNEWVETWSRGLAGLTAEQLRDGLARCITESPKWAPTLGEFRALCEKAASNAPEHRRFLPAPRDTKDRSRELAAILAMLTKKQTAHAA